LEYYQPAFLLIGQELIRRGISSSEPHPLRQSFWRLVPSGEYDLIKARELLTSYLVRVEQELAEILRPQSIAYWLHLYRRIGPGAAGPNDTPATIGWARQIFEAAVQKYAQLEMCNRVAFSNQIPPERILRGLLMGPELRGAREHLTKNPQLVLTDFGTEEMSEVYQAEKLAYEIWRATAALRIIGKGATLLVGSEDPYFADNRSDELDRLVKNYDDRHRDPNVSATGTVFDRVGKKPHAQGLVFMPFYNLGGVLAKEFQDWFSLFRIKLGRTPLGEFRTNFLWAPFNVRAYYQAHKPFSSAFESLHGLPLAWVLAVVAGLYLRVFYIWLEDHLRIVHFWQRAYEGPHTLDYLMNEIKAFLPLGIDALELGLSVDEIDIARVFSFLKLSGQERGAIDLITAGPHSLFLPVGTTHAFIDYCWGFRLLYHMFYGVELPDQNFKGDALERLVHGGQSVLPLKECKSISDTVRQIDAAFKVGDTLVVIECRAVARSFGVDRGDPQALQYRRQKIEKALQDIDEKARWLSQNPVGTNYDIRRFARILPLAVTPFVEYMPSANSCYWLSETLPRVLTPRELSEALEGGVLDEVSKASSHTLPIPPWQ
jgi:hypothetical protein